MIPSWKWARKYCFSKIPVIKGVYKPLFFTEYLVIMLFLSTGIFSKRQNKLYMVWRYTREKLTFINAGLFRAHHLNYSSNIELKSGISQSILNRFSCNFANFIRRYYSTCPKSLVKFNWLFQKLLIYKSIKTLILNRFSCNFSGYIGSFICYCPKNLVKFGQLFQKLLGSLDWLGRSPGVR